MTSVQSTPYRLALFLSWLCITFATNTANAVSPLETGPLRINASPFFAETVGTQFTIPTGMRFDPLGNAWMSDKSGYISPVTGGVFGSTRLLDLTDEVANSGGGEGLLGFLLHPDYDVASSPGYRKLYTYHTIDDDQQGVDFNEGLQGQGNFVHLNVLTEWQVNDIGTQVIAETRRELFRIGQPTERQHSGGGLAFDQDGYLVIGVGSPVAGLGQNTLSISGATARIDPIDPTVTATSLDPVSANGAYRIPLSNPYVGNDDALDELHTYGYRNPFTISLDDVTGELFLGDVGFSSREEVNVLRSGANYGWAFQEGSDRPGPSAVQNPLGELTNPLADYNSLTGRSVIGGFVYRGSAIPELYGKYVFGDLTTSTGPFFSKAGRLFYIDPYDADGELRDPSEIVIHEFIIDSTDHTPEVAITGFSQDLNGELYFFGVDSNFVEIKQIVASNQTTGDFSGDGVVDGVDYALWRESLDQTGEDLPADTDYSGVVDSVDFQLWQNAFFESPTAAASARTPEPITLVIVLIASVASAYLRSPRPRVV